MSHNYKILGQITALIPRHVFDHHADIQHSGQNFLRYTAGINGGIY